VLDGSDFPANFLGAGKIRTAVLLGTPNLGTVNALHSLLAGHKVGLQAIPAEALATMPSVYELMPHPVTNWIVDLNGRPLERDLFFVGTWIAYQWSVFDPQVERRFKSHYSSVTEGGRQLQVLQDYFAKRIERARRFVWSLTYNESQNAPVRLVVFGGDCTLTPARVVVEREPDAVPGAPPLVTLLPGQIRKPVPSVDYSRLMLEPGDGEVTKPSLLARQSLDPTVSRSEDVFFPLAYAFFLCVDHEHHGQYQLPGQPAERTARAPAPMGIRQRRSAAASSLIERPLLRRDGSRHRVGDRLHALEVGEHCFEVAVGKGRERLHGHRWQHWSPDA
jgi:hypothetical protein